MNESRSPSTVRASLGFVAGLIPTIVVLAGVGAVGWWGHSTGWKLEKFSSLTGSETVKNDWCSDHSVPESACVECDPTLLPKATSLGWCKVHGIPECTLDNPDRAEISSPASVSNEDLSRAKRSLEFAPRTENNPICKTHLRRIQFASARDANKAGIEVATVGMAPVVEFVSAPGEIGPNQTRVVHLSSRSQGSVWRVFKRLGDRVQTGDVLALIDASEVGKVKAELLQSFALLQLKVQTLASYRESSVVSEAKIREAEAAVQETQIRLDAARQALVNLGLPFTANDLQGVSADQLKAKLHFLAIPADAAKLLDPRTATTNLLPLVSPMDGLIVSRDVVAGEVVDNTRILFEVVDTRTLWLTCDVTSENARKLKLGQQVKFKPDDGREEVVGKLAWISTQADVKTRTVKVRAELQDPEGKLRANTFGSGRVILREEANAVSVPNETVHWEGCCHIVFVRDKDYLKPDSFKVFHVRKVRIGARDEKNAEIIAGVLPGELVVTQGSGTLLAELLRGNLGEGCACHAKK